MFFCLNCLYFEWLQGSETEPATVCVDEVFMCNGLLSHSLPFSPHYNSSAIPKIWLNKQRL